MEKVISVEERIRRAEEIYNKRKNKNVRVSSATVNSGKLPLLHNWERNSALIHCSP